MAEWFSSKTKPYNAYYERPATLSLLPDVQGLSVLDAGCGPGIYTKWLLDQGAATVVAVDFSAKMIQFAKERVREKAVFHLADLNQPLTFLKSDEFDLILCPLVLDHVKNLDFTFKEFNRVLKRNGILIFSMGHPMSDFRFSPSGDYFKLEEFSLKWSIGVIVTSFRRPLSNILNSLIESNFTLERILEPLPTPEFEKVKPEDYKKLLHNPGFMCIRAKKVQ